MKPSYKFTEVTQVTRTMWGTGGEHKTQNKIYHGRIVHAKREYCSQSYNVGIKLWTEAAVRAEKF